MSFAISLALSATFGWGAFLSYTEVSKTDMQMPKGAPPQVAAMMKNYAPKPMKSKVYVSGSRWASVSATQTTIMDYASETHISVDHQKKTYTQTPLDYWLDHSPMGANYQDAQMSAKHKKLNATKKIAGRSCQMVAKTIEVSGIQGDPKMPKTPSPDGKYKMNSTDCIALSPPAAWKQYMAATEKYWKSRSAKLKKKFKNFDMKNPWLTGFSLYSATKTDMGQTMSKQQAMMMPKTTQITQVSAVSEKAFPASVFQAPKGYKKVKPQF